MIRKLVSILSMLVGCSVGIYNYFFRVSNLTSSAVMQLSDSDVSYGIGQRLATSSNGTVLTLISVGLISYGIFSLWFIDTKNTGEKNEKD